MLLPVPYVAAVYAPAQITLAQLEQKVSGAKGSLERGSYRIVVKIRTTTETRTDTTYIDGDNWRTEDDNGAFSSEYGYFHGRSWHTDANGLLIYTKPVKLPPVTKELLGITTSAPAEYVVQIRGERDTTLAYYDASTFLLVKKDVSQVNGVHSVREFSDYRRVFGEERAFVVSYTDGRPANASTFQTVSFTDAAASSVIPPESRVLYTIASGRSIRLPARFSRQGIEVPVKVGEKSLQFALDTGSTAMNIDAGALASLGLHSKLAYQQKVAGDIDVGHAMLPQLQLGDVTMNDVAFDVIPMNRNWEDGLLGCDAFAPAILAIDFHGRTVQLLSPQSFDPKAVGAIPVPADYDGCVPHITASINGKQGRFLIDTGSAMTILSSEFAAGVNGKRELPLSSEPQLSGIGGWTLAQMYEFPSLIVGPVEFRHATAAVPDKRDWLLSPGEDGILGRDVLSEFTLYFDYANNVVYMKPN